MRGITSIGTCNFSQLANAYAHRHGINTRDLKRAMAKVSVKSHANAVSNPRAHLRGRHWRLAPLPASLSEFFPAGTGTSGLSLSYSFAVTVFGGFAPFIITW
ncbi:MULTISPECIES: hypothetical protein [Bradyrhizobium]|uniref:Uncharacterized protein n=1 Tax=Bradyrhizobium brasilense TaxID=1419277 RepID=A0A1G7JK85_9BRAD|nr:MULTISPECIES: hypothetical protein [Bradyrhizobium]MCA6104278.1 hypothetical protein [Bradyrhizobium australafricanum]MCC8971715.1 hypothetical protein [Bradyrhizobium brasilense]MCP1848875.1 hypothetical protein [Bradyrhizobium sp. USDA 4541]WFU65349.1 hypothetical protein QA636_07375 [Bradyrhizobium brasilense]SDF25331.1 hypothetical protein SAMN05216337_104917 [Bradyrhizobium brasilense]